jgi:hypothetical protein
VTGGETDPTKMLMKVQPTVLPRGCEWEQLFNCLEGRVVSI